MTLTAFPLHLDQQLHLLLILAIPLVKWLDQLYAIRPWVKLKSHVETVITRRLIVFEGSFVARLRPNIAYGSGEAKGFTVRKRQGIR